MIQVQLTEFFVIKPNFLARKKEDLLQNLKFLPQYNVANEAISFKTKTFFNVIAIYHLRFNLIFGVQP